MVRSQAGDVPVGQEWRNLRDDKGRLYGRVHRDHLLLEIRLKGQTVIFDLKDYIGDTQSKKSVVK